MQNVVRSRRVLFSLILFVAVLAAACTPVTPETENGEPAPSDDTAAFIIGAIPDQDPDLLQRRFGLLADYLSDELGVPVEYRPVTDYAASVTAFRVGDLDMVWFGGLTGVQARLQVDGAQALVQRALDEEFRSVFIANIDSGLEPFDDLSGLEQVRGHTFTFGSESSTSGRLMPQYFLAQAGVSLEDFEGEPGFSGAHDVTIELVEAGTFDAGALNQQVWDARVEAGEVDPDQVVELWRTPTYHDYHWVIRPDVTERFGDDFPQRVSDAFINLDINNPDHAEILDLFGAEAFIVTENDNYLEIETVGREVGMIN